ncbi:MAG: tRNA (adenosine(37)-N6)-threonylcarbamoyltransferase complex ATPase subunit type 1 TsaE [bacterium]|nr:tRNA (adenosine(37)-N6)-threonylcarbamoyltransferase complex ATPase subunit type 1 TsaE [bacterium]
MPKFISHSEKETIDFAGQFAQGLRGGEVLLLLGDLGSGKTTFVKGLAQGFGIKEKITSPTFVLMRHYKIRNFIISQICNFIHLDAYRLKTGQDLLAIGLGDWLGRQDTVVAVEWGEELKKILRKKKTVKISFLHGRKNDTRTIKLFR